MINEPTPPKMKAAPDHIPYAPSGTGNMRFDQLVLSGGGTRCFWQGGFLYSIRDEINLEPKRISAVSGGAMIACAFVARHGPDVLRLTKIRFRHTKNFHFNAKHFGQFPHEESYRQVIDSVFDAEATALIANGPPIEVVLTTLPPYLANGFATGLSLITYLIERAAKDATDKTWTRNLGMEELRVDASEAARVDQDRLRDLIVTAARIPPFFAPDRWDNCPVIDGGSISDAPMPSEETGNTLCLLASYFSHLPHKEGRVFIMPSRTIPTGKIDLTESKEIQEAWDLGAEDGQVFLEMWRKGDLDWKRGHKIGDPDWRGRRYRPETSDDT